MAHGRRLQGAKLVLRVVEVIITAIAYNSTLYIIGGYDGTNLLSDVQYTKLNSNGSIGTWSYTANLLQGLQLSGGFAANGYLYMIAGSTSATLGSTCSAATYVASIHANTTIASGNNPTGLGVGLRPV